MTQFNGNFDVYLTANQIGLRDDDELDALAIPEPAAWVVVVTGLAFCGWRPRQTNQRGLVVTEHKVAITLRVMKPIAQQGTVTQARSKRASGLHRGSITRSVMTTLAAANAT